MRIRVLQHVPFEGLAGLEPLLRGGGHEVAVTRLFAGEARPRPDQLDGLVVLGGPMSVHDEHRHAWLAPEKRLVRACLDANKRVLGICLGAQLVAEALGAKVVRNPEREIGWFPVERVAAAADSPLGAALPSRFDAFHWHGETFALPPGALHLARSRACENQAFAWGDRVLALQFHLETTRAAAAALVEHCADELAPAPFVQRRDEILAASAPFDRIGSLLPALLAAIGFGTAPERYRLETARLALRPCEERDVDALHALWTDPDVRRWLWDDRIIDRATAAERVASSIASFARAGWGLWIAEPRGGGDLLGHGGLIEMDPALGPEIIYAFAPRHWGQGYATEAARAVLAYGFGPLRLARIPGRTDTPNRGSARVLERLGMRFDGEALVQGRPTVSYALTREAFEATQHGDA